MCDLCRVRLVLVDWDEYGEYYECPECGREYWREY